MPYNYLSFLQNRLSSEEFKITGKPIDDADYRGKSSLKVFDMPTDLNTELYAHQVDAVNEILNFNKYLLLDGTGLGKTLTAIAVSLKRKEQGAKHTIIICLNSLVFNWLNELTTHCNEPATVLGARVNKKGQLHVKSNKDKLSDLESLDTYFAITNMESLQNKDIVKQLKKMCKKDKINIVVDEFHKGVSNPTTLQGASLQSIIPEFALGMSATLFVNSPLNLFAPLKWVGVEKCNWTAFQKHYCVKGDFNAVIGYKNLDELQTKLDRCSLRREKKMLNLPSISYKVEQLVMGKEQSKLYADVKKVVMDNIDKIQLSPNPLSQLTRLRQCADSTGLLSTDINKSVKFDRMLEIIEDIVARGEKVIIFSNWAEVIKLANERLGGYDFVSVTGSVKDREPLYERFKHDDNCKILTATIGCVGTGLTLISANNVIFIDEPWNYATFEQAFSRIYRIGQEKPCNIISLICKYTIDEKIHNLVYKKKKLGEAMMDTKINLRDPEVLKELLA